MDSSRLRQWVQALAIALVAIPAIGIAALVFREGAFEAPGWASVNGAFHVLLAATLVLVFADFWIAIRRAGGPGMSLALGLGGFIACVVAAGLSELFGPLALALLVVVAAGWAIVLARSGAGLRAARKG